MTIDLKGLYNKTIFVDANAVIYHMQGLCTVSREVFRLGEQRKLKLVSSTRVVDEVIHKTLLIRARDRFGLMSKTISKLRKDKSKVKALTEDIRTVCGFIRAVHLDIKEITFNDLAKLPDMMGSYGLLGSDSLILIMMNKFNLKYLLSSDTDFQDIDWIKLIQAQPGSNALP